MARSKIVVTGLGALAPNGNSVDQFWANSIAGKSGIGPVSQFNTEGHRVTIAGELSDFDPESVLDSREVRKLDPFSIYAITAADEAVTMAGIDPDKLDLDRVGVTIGTGVGGIQTLEDQHTAIETRGPRRVSPLFVPKMIANIAGGHLSMRWGFRGPNQTVTSACASATDAIGMAMRLILAGDADVMIAGGTEASVTGLCIAGFANMKALRAEVRRSHRSPALDRGAVILAELAGYGSTDDAFHITQPAPEGAGAREAMKRAIQDAGLKTTDIDYINAHGTSTPFNDRNETAAIRNLFGSHADSLKVSSTKSMTGHLLGAAGGIEAVITVKAIVHQLLPPTINYETPDPECTLDYVPNTAQEHTVNAALSNTFGFGGHNAVLCFRGYN